MFNVYMHLFNVHRSVVLYCVEVYARYNRTKTENRNGEGTFSKLCTRISIFYLLFVLRLGIAAATALSNIKRTLIKQNT